MTPAKRSVASWANAIPLVTLLAVVFAAGVLYNKLDVLREAVASVALRLDGYGARLEALERWRAIQEQRETIDRRRR